MKRPTALTLLVLLLCLCAQAALAATIYRWVDENGTVHFGERPPEGVDAELVTTASPPPMNAEDADPYAPASAENPGEGEAAPPGMAEQRRQERAERVATQREIDEQLTRMCADQRALVAQLEPRPNILVQDEDGNTRRLDDVERLDTIAKAKKFIEDNCADY